MKKSRLLQKIENYLHFHTNVKDSELPELAEGILEIVVESGMKPPLTKRCPILLTNIHHWENEENE